MLASFALYLTLVAPVKQKPKVQASIAPGLTIGCSLNQLADGAFKDYWHVDGYQQYRGKVVDIEYLGLFKTSKQAWTACTKYRQETAKRLSKH